MDEKYIPVGKFSRTQGLKGNLKILLKTKGSKSLARARKIYLEKAKGQFESYDISELSMGHSFVLVKLDKVTGLEDSSRLVGQEVFIKSEDLPELGEGEYYHYQILGCGVYTEKGDYLGTVSEIFSTGANDIYRVTQDQGKEYLIPAVNSVLISVDLKEKKITIDSKKGLLGD
jgi:16S rRNA processing protein RimM